MKIFKTSLDKKEKELIKLSNIIKGLQEHEKRLTEEIIYEKYVKGKLK